MKTSDPAALLAALGLAAAIAIPAHAQAPKNAGGAAAPAHVHAAAEPAKGAAAANDLTDAKVRKLDKAAGKITLEHGDIKNLNMPAMTMVFVVRDKALLDAVKVGDAVKFRAVDDAGTLTVTTLRAAR